MQNFRELLESDRIHVFDGAMGTMLYAKGVYINRCYDELNLSNPDLVREVHSEYCAPAPTSSRPTPSAPPHTNFSHTASKATCAKSTSTAARLAREGGGDRAYVAGAVGPLGLRIEPYGPTSFDEAKDLFKEQVVGVARRRRGSVSVSKLSPTFRKCSRRFAPCASFAILPIVAQMTIQTDGNTIVRHHAGTVYRTHSMNGAPTLSVSTAESARRSFSSALEKMRAVTKKKLAAQPNAGLPRDVQGRQFYMCSPEYMSKFAKRFIQSGAKFIGGCCGTTPAHIKLISDAVRAASPRAQQHCVQLRALAQVTEDRRRRMSRSCRLKNVRPGSRKIVDGRVCDFGRSAAAERC